MISKAQIARNVVGNCHQEESDIETFLDPLTLSIISLVISSLFQAARLYCELRTANEVQKACVKPSLLQRRMVKQKISFYDINNHLTYKQQQELATAILKTGASTDIHDIEQLLEDKQGEYGEWEV